MTSRLEDAITELKAAATAEAIQRFLTDPWSRLTYRGLTTTQLNTVIDHWHATHDGEDPK